MNMIGASKKMDANTFKTTNYYLYHLNRRNMYKDSWWMRIELLNFQGLGTD